MSSLPPKPDFPPQHPSQGTRTERNDERRVSGGHSPPDRHYPQRDDWREQDHDRDRDRDDRDRDPRSYRPRDPPRSPRSMKDGHAVGSPTAHSHPDSSVSNQPSHSHPPRGDRWVPVSPDRYHGRDYRRLDDSRPRDDRDSRGPYDRRGPGRHDYRHFDRDHDRGRDGWRSQDNDLWRGRDPPSSRRGRMDRYDPRNRHWDREWDVDRDRGRGRDRRYDSWRPSPDHRRDSRSPPRRGDHYPGRACSPRRPPPPPSPSRPAMRSPSPHSVKPDHSGTTPQPDHERGGERRSVSPPRRRRYSRSPSPISHRRQIRLRSRSRSPLRMRPRLRTRSPSPGKPRASSPIRQVKNELVEGPELGVAAYCENGHRSPSPRVKQERDDKDTLRGTLLSHSDVKDERHSEQVLVTKRSSSPFAPDRSRIGSFSPPMNKDKERGGDHEEQREVEREKEKKPMEPHLPVLPRCPPQVKFSARLEEDPDHIRQLAYLAQVSDEARKAGKAWRRALHELDLATLEVKAAQQRHELAETLRKRAHAGVLGIDTSTGAEVDQGAAA